MDIQILEKKISHYQKLVWVCRVVVLLATGTSVWANYLHSDKNPAAIFINILPPLIVLGGFELTSRVPAWKPGPEVKRPAFHPRRWMPGLAMLVITTFGAWLSYWHQKSAFLHYSHDEQTAALLPLSIDGIMIIASVYVLNLLDHMDRLNALKESGNISTYKPQVKSKDIALPNKPKEKEPNQKDRIIGYLRRYPEMEPPAIAAVTGAKLNYVYTVRTAWLASQETETAAPRDLELAMA